MTTDALMWLGIIGRVGLVLVSAWGDIFRGPGGWLNVIHGPIYGVVLVDAYFDAKDLLWIRRVRLRK